MRIAPPPGPLHPAVVPRRGMAKFQRMASAVLPSERVEQLVDTMGKLQLLPSTQTLTSLLALEQARISRPCERGGPVRVDWPSHALELKRLLPVVNPNGFGSKVGRPPMASKLGAHGILVWRRQNNHVGKHVIAPG